MTKRTSRRSFLGSASAAALGLTAAPLLTKKAAAQSAPAAPPVPVQTIPAEKLAALVEAAHKKPGNTDLADGKGTPITMVLTNEVSKAAAEFEYHQHRDHIFQILDGETTYYLGGTPKTPRETKPGEFLAPDSEGAKAHELKKGDYIFIPRMTPHKRVTKASVTFILTSATSN
ncbi:cupin domain-containing protein [Terriglobus tenax]|uniref:cupin domain-containing protein n=1 Tax=Terriglobus tenax TaxID=1111115 RepID=UPI0021DFF130|nr:hypothetical protein [Terriglobus tenax]